MTLFITGISVIHYVTTYHLLGKGMIHHQNAPSLTTAARFLQVTPLTGGAWADLVLLPAEAKFSMEAYSGLLQCCFLKGVGNPSKERVVMFENGFII